MPGIWTLSAVRLQRCYRCIGVWVCRCVGFLSCILTHLLTHTLTYSHTPPTHSVHSVSRRPFRALPGGLRGRAYWGHHWGHDQDRGGLQGTTRRLPRPRPRGRGEVRSVGRRPW